MSKLENYQMHILQTLKHSPESCPLGNPEKREVMKHWLSNLEGLTSKHEIKVVGVWTDKWGHKSWAIYDAPSMEAFSKFETEPESINVAKFNTIKTTRVSQFKETLAFLSKI
jgi:hypothetical protein